MEAVSEGEGIQVLLLLRAGKGLAFGGDNESYHRCGVSDMCCWGGSGLF